MMKLLKKLIFAFALFVILSILIIFGLEAYIQKETSHLIYSEITEVPSAQTGIILGASVHADGKLSPILEDRVETAYQLYKQNKIENFLISGDHRTDDYDEVNAIKNHLLKKDVPLDDMILDHSGFDTYDSMFRAKAVFEIEDAIVITQKFHLPRSLYIARNLDAKYKGFEAAPVAYTSSETIKRREQLANFKAIWEILTKQQPTTMEN
ncbi:YdcF family protein [Salegentibacter sp. JZCK2]|uniref:SanA/YdcF family protein n=1 Tax=Salegentibacter tibetensis TaxID=2873600 RepID=UPI001CCBDBFD|nr:ElyC/SanA/YdcF family protein [Salegentibacter tibetensis]MBZ9729295.1 YdcF family protein [Salegentibacter tibetensis]